MALTKKELEVLDILCKNINKNISYEYLKDIVWINKDISDSTVRDVVSRLKKKLDDINIENEDLEIVESNISKEEKNRILEMTLNKAGIKRKSIGRK
mgnify:CR=1 FL=1